MNDHERVQKECLAMARAASRRSPGAGLLSFRERVVLMGCVRNLALDKIAGGADVEAVALAVVAALPLTAKARACLDVLNSEEIENMVRAGVSVLAGRLMK